MATVMRVAITGAVVFLSCVAAQIVLDAGKDAVQTMLAKNSSTSLPPFIFNGSMTAVKNGTANVSSTCPSNEVFQNCSSACEPTCDHQSPVCLLMCMPPKCQCKSGYVRDNRSSCILAIQCPKVDSCLSNPCSPNQKCVNDSKQCLMAPCPQFKCIDVNPCGMMSQEPLRDAAGHFLNCDSCKDSNHFCLHLSDKQVCCAKSDSTSTSNRLLAELAPFQKNNTVEGEPLNKLVASLKATRWSNATTPLASFVIIHAEPALALDDHQLSHDMEAAFVAACRPLTTMGCVLKGGIKRLFGPSVGDTQVTINTSDVLLECADGGPLPLGVVSIVFDVDPFFAINRNSCTVVSHDINITGRNNGTNMNASAHQHCDVIPDYGVFGFNAFLRKNSEILVFSPVLHSAPVFEQIASSTEESYALKLFALREYAKSQAQALPCTQDNLQAVTAENISGDPLEMIYNSFSNRNQTTVFDLNSVAYYEMVANFSDYLLGGAICGKDREYLNIAHHMSCPYKKAMRVFLSTEFNQWKLEDTDHRAKLPQRQRRSKPNDRFYVKPTPTNPTSELIPPNLSTAELCVESALKNFFENDWIGTIVPQAWASMLNIDKEERLKIKRKPENETINIAANGRNDDHKSGKEHRSCTNETLIELWRKVTSPSASGKSCGKDEQLPHFVWTKDNLGNIYQGYRLINGESLWHRRAICSCNTACVRGHSRKTPTDGMNRGESEKMGDGFFDESEHESGTNSDEYNSDPHSEGSDGYGNFGAQNASIDKVADATVNASSYTDCIATVLRKNGYKGANLNLQQLAAMAATFDKSLVKSIISQVGETCGQPPPNFMKELQLQK